MQDILSAVPALATLIEKGGIVGLLIIALAFLVWELLRIRRELHRVYRQRDSCRLVSARYKYALENRDIKVDISDLRQMLEDDDDE